MARLIRETVDGLFFLEPEDILYSKRKLFLTGEVTPESCDILIKNLMSLNEDDPEAEITLCINSPGGDVSSGLAVYDYIKQMHAPLKTVVVGIAASMGAILFLSGNVRQMNRHSRVMIHDPSYGNSIGGKKPAELAQQVEKLLETKEELCKIIADATGKPLDEIKEMCKEDSWFNAEEALDYHIATEIL